MRRLGATATTRASYSTFSTTADTDRLIEGLAEVRRILQL
jgi:selenocysteine lyase/cysteine desulfurase